MGISKIIDADQLVDCIRRPTNAIVISHEKKATERLFRGVKYYIDNLAVKPLISLDNANEILFPKRTSSYWIGTAGQRAVGRGDEIHRAHLSEAAFYFDLEMILTGISEAAEYGQIDIESSPNGRGNAFYDEWQKAKSGMSPYTPIFIPWFIDPAYSSDSMTAEEISGLSQGVREIFATPENEFQFTDEEKDLRKRVMSEWGIMLTIGQIKWRRYKIWDKGMYFFQEFPEDDVSCFLQSGRPVFSQITVKHDRRIDLEALDDEKDADLIARLKKAGLTAGLDGAEGNRGGDNHSFAVVDPGMDDHEGIAAACFELTNTDPIEVFDERVAKIVKKFNIKMYVEKQGVGSAHILKLKSLQCPFKEWNTTGASRPVMITDLEEAYRKEELVETYPDAENELRDIYYDASNRAVHPQNKHDDRVFARAMAWQARKIPTPRVYRL